MKNRRRLALGFAGVVALVLGLGYFWRQSITYHTLSWHRATRLAIGDQLSWRERIYGALLSKQQPQYWWSQAKRHETELFKKGYLTNCTFLLTNQLTTREFSSNFHHHINQRLGTNEDRVWHYAHLTNQTGISLTFPTEDFAIWERTFRECASLYASNIPPASVTSGTVRAAK